MRNLLLLVFAVMISGCATLGQMEKGLDTLKGENIQTAFDLLGYPSQQQEFNGDKVYTWSNNKSGVMTVPQTSTTTGYDGNTPIQRTTTYQQVIPYNYNCVLKIITDKNNVIKKWQYETNSQCSDYSKILSDYYKQTSESTPNQ